MTEQKQQKQPQKPAAYYVKEGKSITTKKGIKNGGELVTKNDLVGGIVDIDLLVELGAVVKK